MNKRPKTVYCAMVNLSGLSVFTATWYKDLECWYDKTGNLNVNRLGLDEPQPEVTTFASVNEKERDLWVQGARAVMKALQRWSAE